MNHSDSYARTRATVVSERFGRTLLVALLVTVSPLLAMVAVSVPSVALAFVGGVITGGVVKVHRRRRHARHARRSTVAA